MLIYFVIGVIMFVVGFIVGVYLCYVRFKEALEEFVAESKEEKRKRYSDNEFIAMAQEYIETIN